MHRFVRSENLETYFNKGHVLFKLERYTEAWAHFHLVEEDAEGRPDLQARAADMAGRCLVQMTDADYESMQGKPLDRIMKPAR